MFPSWWRFQDCYAIMDCLDGMKQLPNDCVDIIITDPPYGINVAGSSTIGGSNIGVVNRYNPIINDDKALSQEYFDEMFRISKNQIIFGGNYYDLPIKKGWIVWDKKCQNNWNDNFSDGELLWTSFDRPLRIFRHRYMGLLQEERDIRVHPTQKPIPLLKWIIKNYSNRDDIILDPFLGSGTTIRACIETKRVGLGFEIDKNYESIIRERTKMDVPKLTKWI